MQANPGRIAEHDVEATSRVRVGKRGAEEKRKRATIDDAAALIAQRSDVLATTLQLSSIVRSRRAALAEQVARSLCREKLRAGEPRRRDFTIDLGERPAPLFAVEHASETVFPRAGGAHVTLAQLHEPRAAGHRKDVSRESSSDEGVTDADIAVEVRQGRHAA